MNPEVPAFDLIAGSLKKIEEYLRPKTPIDLTVEISSTQWWTVEYKNRKHVYLWLPSTSLTISFADYGSGTVQAQVWTNIGMPEGIRMMAPNNSSLTPVMLRFTDEVIP